MESEGLFVKRDNISDDDLRRERKLAGEGKGKGKRKEVKLGTGYLGLLF